MDLLRFLLRLPFTLLRAVWWLISIIFRLATKILSPFIGKIEWQSPRWTRFIGKAFNGIENWINRHPKGLSFAIIVLAAVSGASIYGYHWNLNRPKPIEPAPIVYLDTNVRIQTPQVPNYNAEKQTSQRVVLRFSHSAAPIALVGKTVTQGVSLTPTMEGEWKWEDERSLVFIAKKIFPMGQTYQVKLDAKELVAPQIKLDKTQYEFTTTPFSYRHIQSEFYQDPRDPKKKSALFSVLFNAPVDVISFEKQLALSLLPNQKLNYSVTYNDKKTQAWILSEPIALPDDGGKAALQIGKGIKSTVNANETKEASTLTVNVPGLYSLILNNISAVLVESNTGKGSKALIISTNDAIHENEIKKAVKVWLLPQHNPEDDGRNLHPSDFHDWGIDEIDNEVIAKSQPVALSLNDTEQESQSLFSFAFDAPSNRFLLVEVENNITSVGGYKLKYKHHTLVTVPDYPQMLSFMSEGALLSMHGEKQITVAARNLPGFQLDIRRVIPSQLQHIVSFKDRNFTSTNFRRLDSDYFTEHFKYQSALKNSQPGEINYQGIDLSRYLTNSTDSRRGIFLLDLSSWDPQKKENRQDDDEYDGNDPESLREQEQNRRMDSRFIVITDLGILTKKSLDGSRDVFVQSISSGSPVNNAKVSVIAKNGTTLLTQTTGADGHVKFPSLEAFNFEREPVMFLVEKEGDVSFLPTNAYYDRQLDFSRFDIYGEETPKDPRTLNSYLFSDRGIYRPGETFNIGLITRTVDWKTSVAGIPLRAEIRDPRDTVMSTVPLTLDKSGFNELSYTTGENSPTGDWTVYLYLVGKDNTNSRLLGSTTVKVKEFEPDRLKVSLKLTPERQQGWVKPQELKASIDVQNLFGTPAQDRRVTSKLTLRPIYPSFSQFSDYLFYENRHRNEGFDTDLEERTTDQNGMADIELGLNSYADATYQLQLISEAFEAGGGRSVTAAARVIVSPYDYLVGVKADGSLDYMSHHAERHLNIIAINSLLEQIALQDLEISLIEQKYLSVLTKQESGIYKYQSKLKEEVISQQAFNISQQGTNFTVPTDKPGNFVLVIKDKKDNVLNRINYTVAGNANVSRSLDRNAELKLKLNKTLYQQGEEIEVAINAPYTGSGVITIERDKVYSWQWFHSDTTSSIQKIEIPDELEGNGYINVQFIRDMNSDEIFMSPLSYGVIPFKISHQARQAEMSIDSPEVIKPGETLEIKVTTNSPQRVAVFAVDEGILQVARYQLKDPLDYFFRKRALSVDSAQILDLILPEFSKIMSLTSAPGGDSGESVDLHLNPFKRKKDKPVAYWSGITDVNREKTFNYPVPDYFNGKIRVMAISVTPERIGRAQHYTTVRDDFILSPNMPTTVSPQDEFDVTVGVANNLTTLDGQKADLKVTLDLPPSLQIIGDAEQTLTLAEKQEGVVTFRLRASENLGNASVTFKTVYADKSAQRTVSLSIRPAMPYRTQSAMGRMDGQKQSVKDIRQMFSAFAQRDAMVSHSPLVLTKGLAKYLADYPNTCSEQMISRSIPLLFKIRHQELVRESEYLEIHAQLKQTITTLLSRQNSQGAIGAWRSTPNPDPFVTPYAVQYLLEAKAAYYPVPEDLLKSSNRYLKQLAADDARRSLSELRLRAFSAYLLTRQGEITTNMLAAIQTRLQKNYPERWQEDLSALYLAASYKMLKMDKEADTLLQPTWKLLSKAYDKAWWTQSYLDPLVLDSTRLYLITRHFPKKAKEIPPQLLENIVLALKAERYTTLSSAMSILALEQYSNQIAAQASSQDTLTISSQSRDSNAPFQVISELQGIIAKAKFAANTQELQFNNTSKAPAWYVVTQSGYDLNAPKQAISRGLEIIRDYTDERGRPVTEVTLGQKLNVHVKVRANSQEGLDNIAIVDLLPGGFEVVQQTPYESNTNENDGEAGNEGWISPIRVRGSTWQPEYSDIREDRVIIYGSATNKVQEFIYQIKSTNTGTFTIPPAYGEAMYDREVQALSIGGTTLTVNPPSTQAVDNESAPDGK